MRLTVLGSSASYAGAGQACSGYLVEAGSTRVLLECGNGVVANLAQVTDPLAIDAVFISHRHPDHFVDLYSLQALLRYAPEGPGDPLVLWAPPGFSALVSALLSPRGAREFDEAFRSHDLVASAGVTVGDVRVTPWLVDHVSPTFGFMIEGDGVTLAYTADTRPSPSLVALANGADLLLAEATLPEQYVGRAPHLTGSQAGAVAAEADVGMLVLTHLWPTGDREAVRAAAMTAFSGPVELASEFRTYDVRPGTGRAFTNHEEDV